MEIKFKVWIEKDGKVLFGRGRDDILKAIDEQRSLNAAAKRLEMSYRAASVSYTHLTLPTIYSV